MSRRSGRMRTTGLPRRSHVPGPLSTSCCRRMRMSLRSWLRERAARLKSLVDRAAFAESERAKYRFE